MTEQRTPHGNLSSEEATAVVRAGELALEAIAGRLVVVVLDDNEQIVRGDD